MHTPTPEQSAIIDFAKQEKRSLMINALAGAAKTSTAEMVCYALPLIPILYLAFNKRVADEAQDRLPNNVSCKTFNALGHRVWGQALGKRLTLNKDKSRDILRELIQGYGRDERNDAFEAMGDILQTVRLAKQLGYVPDGFNSGIPLVRTEEFYGSLEEDQPRFVRRLVDEIIRRTIKQSYDGTIDFDDQIYMPVVFGGSFPRFPLVIVDETQDLSRINHAFLEKLVTGRLIAVGDPWQSIYGFRGAVFSGMSLLRDKFDMAELTLSVSFRCPRRVIERARSHVPHMQWPDWAREGHVEELHQWDAQCIPDGSAIICRNNAPLFSLALKLIRAKRGVQIVGADIGPGLVRVMKKLGPMDAPQALVFNLINAWEAVQQARSRNPDSVADRAECLRVFAENGENLGHAVAFAELLFQTKGPIQLLSGHKAKGLEWDTVYHLDPWRIPSRFAASEEDRAQEMNVRYVIETRAKKELYLIDSKGMQNGL